MRLTGRPFFESYGGTGAAERRLEEGRGPLLEVWCCSSLDDDGGNGPKQWLYTR